MVDPVTPIKALAVPTHGSDVNSWDVPLNSNFTNIDTMLGGTVTKAFTNINVQLSFAESLNFRVVCTGLLTGNVLLTIPTAGYYVIDNQCTGAFTLTVLTLTSTTIQIIPQGGHSFIYIDTGLANVVLCDDNTVARFFAFLGTPGTHVAGTAASASGGFSSVVWDATNFQLNVCTLTGPAATAIWTPIAGANMLFPQGYLSASLSLTNPVIQNDVTAANVIYYTPFIGNWTLLSNGTSLYPYQFSQLSVALSNSQASNNLYDIFLFANSNSPVIGTGPSWSAGVSGSNNQRGTGPASTSLARLDGAWTNAVQINLLNGASTFICPANQGVYLGTIWIDTAAGQVTCHRSYGQSRKFGVWNAYNRQSILLKAGDSTVSWPLGAQAAFRNSNASSANSISTLMGLQEEECRFTFDQHVTSNVATGTPANGIGYNSNTVASGLVGGGFANGVGGFVALHAEWTPPSPPLGVNTAACLEQNAGGSDTFAGTETRMVLCASYRG